MGFQRATVIASGDDVVVDVHLAYTVKRTGKLVDLEQLHWWSLSDRRVTRLRHFEDTACCRGLFSGPARGECGRRRWC